ncbi:MAG TPA: helix-turn-helix domain-containing protein [Pyrinomonadaceae bacterium]|nr:helix-turn-helix domain-containing protein [Pyrinomonadaceae bacterium]
MKPLFHPSIDEITVEGILFALSDPVRLEIFAKLAGGDTVSNCLAFQNLGDRPIPKSTLSQHFKVLRESGLIRSERRGVEIHNTSRCKELDKKFPGLITAIIHSFSKQRKSSKK